MESEDEDCQCESDEDMNLMFCKFKEFMRHKTTLKIQKKQDDQHKN